MPVHFEDPSLIVSKDTIKKYLPGGLDAWFELCDSSHYLEDDYITKLSHRTTKELQNLVEELKTRMTGKSVDYEIFITGQTEFGEDWPDWLDITESGCDFGIKCVKDPSNKVVIAPQTIAVRDVKISFNEFRARLNKKSIKNGVKR